MVVNTVNIIAVGQTQNTKPCYIDRVTTKLDRNAYKNKYTKKTRKVNRHDLQISGETRSLLDMMEHVGLKSDCKSA